MSQETLVPIEIKKPSKTYVNEIRIIKIMIKSLIYLILIGLIIYLTFLMLPALIGAFQVLTNLSQLLYILYGTGISSIRILVSVIFMLPLIVLATYVSLNKLLKSIILPLFQILASIPAPLLFPLIVYWLGESRIEFASIIIIMLGSMWYVFYNSFSAVESIPNELREACTLSGLQRFLLFKKLYIPALMPGLITGLITAVGGAWNALIVAEWITLGNNTYEVHAGIGKIIDQAANAGNFNLMYAALLVMVIIVVVLDRTVWRKLYDYVTSRYKYEV
jgi:NitT/TauT family transport system permease protein